MGEATARADPPPAGPGADGADRGGGGDVAVRLRILALTGQALAEFELPPDATVAAAKTKIFEATGVPSGEQRLVPTTGSATLLKDHCFVGDLAKDKSMGLLEMIMVCVERYVAVSWSSDRSLRLWDLGSGTAVHDFGGHVSSIVLDGVEINWASGLALSWGGDHTMRLWDIERGVVLQCLDRHTGKVLGAQVDWTHSRVVSWGVDRSLRVWDLKDKVDTELRGHSGRIQGVEACWEKHRAISQGASELHLWDLERCALLSAVRGAPGVRLLCAVDPGWAYALCGSPGSPLQLWGLETAAVSPLLDHVGASEEHMGWAELSNLIGVPEVRMDWRLMRGLLWHTDGGRLCLWDMCGSCLTARVPGLRAVQVDWRCDLAVSWSISQQALSPQLWDVGHSGELRGGKGSRGHACGGMASVEADVDWERRLALSWAPDAATMLVWDLRRGAVAHELRGHADALSGVQVDWVQDRALSWSAGDTTLRLWDLAKGAVVHVMEREPIGKFGVQVDWEWNSVLCWTEDVWGNADFTLELWDLERGEVQHVMSHHTDAVRGASMSRRQVRASGAGGAGQLVSTGKSCLLEAMRPSAKGHRLLASFVAGELDGPIAGWRDVLRALPSSQIPTEEQVLRRGFRESGEVHPKVGYFLPVRGTGDQGRLLLLGDATMAGLPGYAGPPFGAAIAKRNPRLLVENNSWGSLMAATMANPGGFKTSLGTFVLPRPRDHACDYACVLIGTSDAMAIAGSDAASNLTFGSFMDNFGYVGIPMLPVDWENCCRPSLKLYEQSLRSSVQELMAVGARVAIVTPPPLGEELADAQSEERLVRHAPFRVVSELASAVRRVAASEGCDVLPLFECCIHRLREQEEKGRKLIPWGPQKFWNMRLKINASQAWGHMPWEDMEFPGFPRPVLHTELTKLNESGLAIFAALLQSWLDAQVAARSGQ